MPVPRVNRSRALAPLRPVTRRAHRSIGLAGGRRLPPSRGLFAPLSSLAPIEVIPNRLYLTDMLLGVAALAALADLLSLQLAPALSLPFYTLAVVICVLVVVLALLGEPPPETICEVEEYPIVPREAVATSQPSPPLPAKGSRDWPLLGPNNAWPDGVGKSILRPAAGLRVERVDIR